MSGFLEVKLPSKCGKGFSSWKAWKKQWCILIPCTVKEVATLIFHSSKKGTSNSQVEIPKQAVLCRSNTDIRKYACGIYWSPQCYKPLLYIAGENESEIQTWMLRIRIVLCGKNFSSDLNLFQEKLCLEKNQFSVSLIDGKFSTLCGYSGVYGKLIIKHELFCVIDYFTQDEKLCVKYCDIATIDLIEDSLKFIDNGKVCIIKTNSEFQFGEGQIDIFCFNGRSLYKSLRQVMMNTLKCKVQNLRRRLSRSEDSLLNIGLINKPINSSWYCLLDQEITYKENYAFNSVYKTMENSSAHKPDVDLPTTLHCPLHTDSYKKSIENESSDEEHIYESLENFQYLQKPSSSLVKIQLKSSPDVYEKSYDDGDSIHSEGKFKFSTFKPHFNYKYEFNNVKSKNQNINILPCLFGKEYFCPASNLHDESFRNRIFEDKENSFENNLMKENDVQDLSVLDAESEYVTMTCITPRIETKIEITSCLNESNKIENKETEPIYLTMK